MSKHTPGSWFSVPGPTNTPINSETKHIAMINWSYRGLDTDIMGEEHEANAYLIESAPELLEALEWTVRALDKEHPAAIKARRAIAKAKGEL